MDIRSTAVTTLLMHFTAHASNGVIESVIANAVSQANKNASHNTYIWRDPEWSLKEARRVEKILTSHSQGLSDFVASQLTLSGLPVSVKDCFDLAGTPTSCGTSFYRDHNGIATEDSWLVRSLRQSGAVITGKTHLHPLAYGITGENPEFGDCLQPGNPAALTGGSSSGAAASILEGSAIAAIGTDTGGSIRVPAALCGLVGYRASLGRGNWTGAAHLAESFDTMGWLFRDLSDATLLAALFMPPRNVMFAESVSEQAKNILRKSKSVAVVADSFLEDAEPAVLGGFHSFLEELASLGLKPKVVSVAWWSESRDIFGPIQAWEAARHHRGNFAHFEQSIRERLEWGASLTDDEIVAFQLRLQAFRARMDSLLQEFEYLALPVAPVTQLLAGADHSQTRSRLLRYTTPVSLAGMPAVTIPGSGSALGSGVQLVASRDQDEALLGLVHQISEARKKLNGSF